jgi:hypothetical protein
MSDQRQQPQRCYLDDCENHERDRCNVMAIGLSMSARDARDHSERSKSSSTFWMSDCVSHPRSRRGSSDSRIIMSTSHRHPRQVAISSSSQTYRSEPSYRDFALMFTSHYEVLFTNHPAGCAGHFVAGSGRRAVSANRWRALFRGSRWTAREAIGLQPVGRNQNGFKSRLFVFSPDCRLLRDLKRETRYGSTGPEAGFSEIAPLALIMLPALTLLSRSGLLGRNDILAPKPTRAV